MSDFNEEQKTTQHHTQDQPKPFLTSSADGLSFIIGLIAAILIAPFISSFTLSLVSSILVSGLGFSLEGLGFVWTGACMVGVYFFVALYCKVQLTAIITKLFSKTIKD